MELNASLAESISRAVPASGRENGLMPALTAVLTRLRSETDPAAFARLLADGNCPADCPPFWREALRSPPGVAPSLVPHLAELRVPAEAIVEQLPAFCEQLIRRWDRQERQQRGVYFTPGPLADFVAAAADWCLQTFFDLPAGLARPVDGQRLRIVDPSCGAGSLLGAVIRRQRSWYQLHDQAGWQEHVRNELPRMLWGFDLCEASLLVAAELLRRLADVPLTDESLSSVARLSRTDPLASSAPWQRLAVANCLPVVIGNPPYSSFGSRNRSPWILGQLERYKQGLGERKHGLHDDLIKFIRWSELCIEKAGQGVVVLVTSNTWLRGLTHRRLRAALLETFDELLLLDLQSPAEYLDAARNVFGIRQPVAVCLLVRHNQGSAPRVRCARLAGQRTDKLQQLRDATPETIPWQAVEPVPPQYRFLEPAPGTGTAAPRRTPTDYDRWPRLTDLFPNYVSGVQTKYDRLLVGRDPQALAETIRRVIAGTAAGELPDWLATRCTGVDYNPAAVRDYLTSPFDYRAVYYEPALLGRARFALLRHMLQDNLAIVFMRQSTNAGEYDHFLVTNCLASDRVFTSRHGAPFIAPLWLYTASGPEANVDPDVVARLLSHVERRSDVCPGDLLAYVYAAVHRSAYRKQFQQRLREDFPRIPPPPAHRHLSDSWSGAAN